MGGALGSRESLEAKRARLGTEPVPERDLAHYLIGEYQAGEPMRLTSWRPSETGQQLSDRLVSRLEVQSALRLLPYRRRRIVELRFLEDRPVGQVAERLGISERTLYAEQHEALRTLVSAIYEWGESPAA